MYLDLPLIGLGTYKLVDQACVETVQLALEFGYKHIDTAHVYHNHTAIAKGIKNVTRSSFFLTSKLSLPEQIDIKDVKGSVRKACEKALKELEVDFLDLYLIHLPYLDYPLLDIYFEMHRLAEKGMIKHSGVSNYTITLLKDLVNQGLIPFANQVEFHPYLYQIELLEYCNNNGIRLISYRSFGKGELLEESLFDTLGQKYRKTGAQIILRWLYEKNIPVIPKAYSKKHLQENLDILDFSLTKEENQLLDCLNQNKRYCLKDLPLFQ